MGFKLRNLKVTRVDTVDAGANQDSHILIAKNKVTNPVPGGIQFEKERDCGDPNCNHAYCKKARAAKGTAFPERMATDVSKAGLPASPSSAPRVAAAPSGFRRVASPAPTRAAGGGPSSPSSSALGGGAKGMAPGERSTNSDHPNQNSRLSHISPADFQSVEGKNGTTEWYIPPESLPEGVEEAIITMVPGGDAPTFQWMVDPVVGPPVDGVAKTAAEAFMAMRSALTQSGVANTNATGPLAKPKSRPLMKRMKRKVQLPVLDITLNALAKGLVESGVFVPSTTGSDLRAILPPQIIDELTNVTKSADKSAGYQEVSMADELETLAEQVPEEVLAYIEELETENALLTKRLSGDSAEDDPIAKALSTLDPSVAEIFKAQTSRLEAAEKSLAEEKIAKANATWISKAQSYANVVDDPNAFGQILREVADTKPELATAIETVLKAANERVAKGDLFAEFGQNSGLPTDLDGRVEALAKSYTEADAKLTAELARAEVWERNPDLYQAHLEEQRKRARSI